jgi:preprotein translocase subunit SecY
MTADFVRRAGFTVGALLVYRLGCNIPLPGLNFQVLGHVFRMDAALSLNPFIMFPGNIKRLSIFSLDIMPYISAAVFLQVASIVLRPLRALQVRGEHGRQIMRKLTFGLTIVLAGLQAYGVAVGLEGVNEGVPGATAVENPGWPYLISATLTLTGGTIFLAWLSERITAFGIGNGIALILLAGTTSAIREPIAEILFNQRPRILPSSNGVLESLAAVVLVTGFVVLVERARRCFQIDYLKRQVADCVFEGLSSILPVKLNPAGIIPVILASWLLNIMLVFIFSVGASDLVTTQLVAGRPAYYVLYGGLIFLCALFYAAYLFSPEDIAARLQKQGATIRPIASGDATVTHLDFALSRTVLIGAVYLTVICLMPDIVLRHANVPFRIGGLSLLILVCTVLDFEDQVRGYLGLSRRGSADPSVS